MASIRYLVLPIHVPRCPPGLLQRGGLDPLPGAAAWRLAIVRGDEFIEFSKYQLADAVQSRAPAVLDGPAWSRAVEEATSHDALSSPGEVVLLRLRGACREGDNGPMGVLDGEQVLVVMAADPARPLKETKKEQAAVTCTAGPGVTDRDKTHLLNRPQGALGAWTDHASAVSQLKLALNSTLQVASVDYDSTQRFGQLHEANLDYQPEARKELY